MREVCVIGDLPEQRKKVASLSVVENETFSVFSKYSDLTRLYRVVAYCLRFLKNCKSNERDAGPLSLVEITKSEKALVKIVQRECFREEINLLKRGVSIKKGKISSLNPFLDEENLLRVGGRINLGPYKFEKKHPCLLGAKHPFTKLVIQAEHKRLLHAGPQMVLSSVRETFWPLGGKGVGEKGGA
ncbi:hypothetical protein NQ314_017752 [Rhamnusium bicolor]|uniref:Uncharacterized protein n=1 Tax=Rhamnusium bicolor TaxID=1586634 RepID=A0AAV8WT12_9CUCU|nr:hypothetical protein NQ314_017752 [Rhamnusium bicolor]